MGVKLTSEEEAHLKERLSQLESALRKRGRIQDALAVLIFVVVFRLTVVSWEVDGEINGNRIKASSGPGLEWIADIFKVSVPVIGPLVAAVLLVPQSARADVIAKVLGHKG